MSAALKQEPTWRLIERPVGPQPIPDWVSGARIEWLDQYSNPPSVYLKSVGAHSWPDKRWHVHKGLWSALHPDGRGEFLSHHGSVTMTTLRRRREGVSIRDDNGQIRKPDELWEDYQGLATTQQEGFAGREFPVVMADDTAWPGQTIILRGPWYGGRMGGYQEVTTVEMAEPSPYEIRRRIPWYRRGGTFGLFLRQDVLINVLSRFLPYLELAAVERKYEPRVQPLKPEWDAPKHWIYERERAEGRT